MLWAMRRRMPTIRIVSTAMLGWRPGPFAGASGGCATKASRSSWVTRPAGPVPRTKRRSTPASSALRRTAGEASGFSPGGRGAPRGGGWATRGRGGGAGLRSASSLASGPGAAPAGASEGGASRVACAAAAAFGAPFGGGAGAESGIPGASMRTSSEPTGSTSPTAPPSATTVPATGVGISTVALSVMTATTA